MAVNSVDPTNTIAENLLAAKYARQSQTAPSTAQNSGQTEQLQQAPAKEQIYKVELSPEAIEMQNETRRKEEAEASQDSFERQIVQESEARLQEDEQARARDMSKKGINVYA